jgi:hypothetical protein
MMRAFRHALMLCVLTGIVTGASQPVLGDVFDDKTCAGDDGDSPCHFSLVQGKAEALRRAQLATDHMQNATGKVTNIEPFDCDAYTNPAQILRTGGAETVFYLRTLDVFTGSYSDIYPIDYSRTSPPFVDINSCAISPLTSLVYCAMMMPGKEHYVVRLDSKNIEYVARLPDTKRKYIACAFGPTGNFHFSAGGKKRTGLVSASGIDKLQGFQDQHDPSLTDWRHLEETPVTKVADWVAFKRDIPGAGKAEWLMGIEKGTGKVVLLNGETKKYKKLKATGLPDDRAAYGAGWSYQGRLFFASNFGEGVYELNINSIDLKKKQVYLEKVGDSAPTNYNDGLNCLKKAPPSNWVPTFISECTIYGDPHVMGFDRASIEPVISLLDVGSKDSLGDFWLVKSPQVQMQGRFNRVEGGRLFLRGLAVSGPFLQGNTLLISGHIDGGKVFWNSEEILTSAPSKYSNDFISANFGSESLVQDSTRKAEEPGFDIDLPLGVKLLLNRGRHGLGVKITMPQMEGLDGQCGNFNGDGQDDTPKLISERMGMHVLFSELLFRHPFLDTA